MPDPAPLELAAIGVVFLLSAFLQGLAGFGFGMVSMAMLPFLIGARMASVVVAPFAVLNTVMLLWSLRSEIQFAALSRLVPGAVVGVPLGVMILTAFPEGALRRLIGFVILAYCVYEAWRRRAKLDTDISLSLWWGVPVGVLAGALGGAVNVGGPPIVLFLYLQPWKRDAVRATLCAFFLFVAALKVALLLKGGMLPTSPTLYGVVIPLMWVGGTVGLRLGGALSKRRFTATVLVMLAVTLVV
ncbi:sulfite exporter TauE/SafE family protein [Candidatus Poribacteria bacterium]|nr:sulfite exporter TauE/SafE family protein [Candidatus Poribacteria bacterium]